MKIRINEWKNTNTELRKISVADLSPVRSASWSWNPRPERILTFIKKMSAVLSAVFYALLDKQTQWQHYCRSTRTINFHIQIAKNKCRSISERVSETWWHLFILIRINSCTQKMPTICRLCNFKALIAFKLLLLWFKVTIVTSVANVITI